MIVRGVRSELLFSLGVATLLCAITFGAHLGNGLVYDDHAMIEQSGYVKGDGPWSEAFVVDEWSHMREVIGRAPGYYRPFFTVLNRAIYAVGGGSTTAFHMVSLGAHITAVWLGAFTLGLLGIDRTTRLCAAALFAVHPLASEVVYWVACFGDQLQLIGFLGALTGILLARRTDGWKRLAAHAGSLACVFLALFSKESAIIVAPLLTIEALAARGDLRSRLAAVMPAWVATGAFLAVRYAVVGGGSIGELYPDLSWSIGHAGFALWVDFRQLLFPYPLRPFHSFPWGDVPGVALTGWVSVAALSLGGLLLWWRSGRAFFWYAWIVLPLLPRLVLLFTTEQNRHIVAERYLYQSLLPWCVFVVAAARLALARVDRLHLRRVVGATVMVTALAGAGIVAYTHGRVFASDRTFFLHRDNDPNHSVVLMSRSQFFIEDGEPAEALEVLDHLIRIEPRVPNAHVNKGIALMHLGRLPEAIGSFEHALTLDAELVGARVALGDALRVAGRLDDAGQQYAMAVAMAPDSVPALSNLGSYEYVRGDARAAVRHWEQALSHAPDDPQLLFNLGLACRSLGDRDSARRHLSRFLAVANDDYTEQRQTAAEWLEELQ